MRYPLGAIILLVLAPVAIAQTKHTENTLKLDDPAKPGSAALADLAWLAGHWVGDGLGGTCEEVWVPPLAGSKEMMGMFRYVKDGKLVFTEHWILVEGNGTLTLKLKHFNPSFHGWEEKDKFTEFKFIKADKDAAYFHGLTFRKTADGLNVYVAIKRDGKVSEAPFHFKPAKSAGK